VRVTILSVLPVLAAELRRWVFLRNAGSLRASF
jgi:hypothetical protein